MDTIINILLANKLGALIHYNKDQEKKVVMPRCFDDFIIGTIDQDHVWEPVSFSEASKDKKW